MAVNYNPKIVTNGLAFYLDAANTKSYPGSGTTWTDLSGNGNTGTLTNGPTFGSANGGQIVFDGVDDYITVPNFPLSFTSQSFTIRMILNITTISPGVGLLLCGSSPFNAGGTGVEIRARTGGYFEATVNDGTGSGIRIPDPAVSGSIVAGRWTEINFVFDRTLLMGYFYQDGILTSSKSYAGELSTSTTFNLSIGTGTDYKMTGKISLVSVYTRALTAAEIAQNYNALRGRYGI